MIVGSSNYDLENEKICVNGMAGMGADGFIVQPTVHFETMWSESNVEKPIVYFDSPNSAESGCGSRQTTMKQSMTQPINYLLNIIMTTMS
jgi:DNA-binding LacI/PurR family transcriptional regulator